jgi:ribosomal protein S18 acetylase RimI-like enzyme
MNETKISYRNCDDNDIGYLLWLRKETMNLHLNNSGFNLDDESHLKRIMYEFESAKLIYLNDKKIGLLKILENEKSIEIIQIQIEPKNQGKGIGEKIIKTIIENNLIKKKPIFLSVLKQNNAKKLYEKIGFRIKTEDEHSFIMEI